MDGFLSRICRTLLSDVRVDLTAVALLLGSLLFLHALATLFWSAILRRRLAGPVLLLGLLIAQALCFLMIDTLGWFPKAVHYGRTLMILPLWTVTSLMLLNATAYGLTRLAGPIVTDKGMLPRAGFGFSGLFSWVFRQETLVKDTLYVAPALPPLLDYDRAESALSL